MDYKRNYKRGGIVRLQGLPEITRTPNGSARIIDTTVKPAPRPLHRSSLFSRAQPPTSSYLRAPPIRVPPTTVQHVNTRATIPTYTSKHLSPEAAPRSAAYKKLLPTVAPVPRTTDDYLRSTQNKADNIEQRIFEIKKDALRNYNIPEQNVSRSSTPNMNSHRVPTPTQRHNNKRAVSASPAPTHHSLCNGKCLAEDVFARLEDISNQLESLRKMQLEQAERPTERPKERPKSPDDALADISIDSREYLCRNKILSPFH